jgi:DNA-binding NarL/FixJ family response regulator
VTATAATAASRRGTYLFDASADRSRPAPVAAVHPNGARAAEPIRVLIACGDTVTNAGLRALLDVEPDIAVAGCAADAEQAVAVTRQIRPDVLLIEGPGSVELTRRVVADPEMAATHVLILSQSEVDEEVFAFLRAGASGCLPRDIHPAELAHGVRAVARGGTALSPRVVRRVIAEVVSRLGPPLPSAERLDALTEREREVIALLAMGLSNDEIAEHLVISHATAKTHVSRALRKLDARSRAELVAFAYKTGLVSPNPPQTAASATQSGRNAHVIT